MVSYFLLKTHYLQFPLDFEVISQVVRNLLQPPVCLLSFWRIPFSPKELNTQISIVIPFLFHLWLSTPSPTNGRLHFHMSFLHQSFQSCTSIHDAFHLLTSASHVDRIHSYICLSRLILSILTSLSPDYSLVFNVSIDSLSLLDNTISFTTSLNYFSLRHKIVWYYDNGASYDTFGFVFSYFFSIWRQIRGHLAGLSMVWRTFYIIFIWVIVI